MPDWDLIRATAGAYAPRLLDVVSKHQDDDQEVLEAALRAEVRDMLLAVLPRRYAPPVPAKPCRPRAVAR